ncbi:GerAB/ArcD/ProY family transporter [Thermohalobacter berrensis]|uniref:Spore gernimation protein n=1 Tax=Thermohalobacter berrensis TaxID=99594 RepID=A0A419T1Q9_9FIRM|nr:GerAB/ArcD/ProY family transporter [Thermohalobacter berrensis]RKD31386.1 spore gernimation protein [Thermohalobacter berrensis]
MITKPKDKISTIQATLAISATIIGVGILTLPRTAGKAVGTPDIWLAVLLGGLIVLVFGYIVAKLSQRFPDKTFFEYSLDITGKSIGYLINIFIVVYFTLLAAYEARILAELIRTYLLSRTPIEVIITIFISVGVYLVVGGINPLVRIFEFFFPIVVFLFLFTMFIGLSIFELENLRPVLGQGIMPVLKGVQATALSYLGFEIMLIFTSFMEKPKDAVKATFIGISLTIVCYLITVVVAIGGLTVKEAQSLTWPTAAVAAEGEIPGAFLERFEVFFTIMWTLAIFTTYAIAHYISGLGLGQIFKRNINPFIYGLVPVIYIIAMAPQNLNTVFQLGDILSYMAILTSGIIPTTLLLIAMIRGIGNEKKKF